MARVTDFHSHILPGIDDGSRDVDTSVNMLNRSTEQGVERIIFTPHFYASRDRIERFLEKRGRSYETLLAKLPPDAPDIVLGAEVTFFPGIGKAEKLDRLLIGDTDLLLLEMPFMPWKEADIREVAAIMESRGCRVLLAHLERYLDLPGNRAMVEKLLELPVFVQINAESLLDWKKRGRLVRMFRDGRAHVLGSDCHGVHHRTPNLAMGREVLGKKLGAAFLERMDAQGEELLRGHNITQ